MSLPGCELLFWDEIVAGSIPLRVIGGENATSFDVKSVGARIGRLTSADPTRGTCSGSLFLNGTGEDGGVLRLSVPAKVVTAPGEGGELTGE